MRIRNQQTEPSEARYPACWAIRCALLATILAMSLAPGLGQRFYPDDPLEKEPPPNPTIDPAERRLSELIEYFTGTFTVVGERHPEVGVIPSQGVNTLGEVMDGPWYTNRHARKRMTPEELVRGPGDGVPPDMSAPWRVLTVKGFGLRPGALIRDSAGHMYLLRFDPPNHLEMATGAEIIASKFFYALGYNTPENYIVYFQRDQMVAAEGGKDVTSLGISRQLIEDDISDFLRTVAYDKARGYRAVATRVPARWTQILGPYQIYGTRSDDPNDISPHEHRRDLRGLFVFCSWLNWAEYRAVNTLDVVRTDGPVPYIEHYIVDFVHALGADGLRPKAAWEGHERNFEFKDTFKNAAGFGIYTPRWMRANYKHQSALGRFESEAFDARRWKANLELAPFENRLPDDELWAAQKLMAFTDDDIATIVSTAQYSDPDAKRWMIDALIARRDAIGRAYFNGEVLPLDEFAVVGNELKFTDLNVKYGFGDAPAYEIQWAEFDNFKEESNLIRSLDSPFELPPVVSAASEGSYFLAQITAGDREKHVTVYLRKEVAGLKLVGINRGWPGKRLANLAPQLDTGASRYNDLAQSQKALFDTSLRRYNETTGRSLTAEEYFNSLQISERTTFDAVTHALLNSRLTDESGASLGNALEQVAEIERIAGQYYGRSGDQQFRLYVVLKPGARETLGKSTQFFEDHENTVYHVGYPTSYRQSGKVPNIQISVSEDGTKGDIDVDYRSSKMPQALYNGHLTSENSDVRAGNNYLRHNARWAGFVAWWKDVFGNLEKSEEERVALFETEAVLEPTPLPPNRSPGAPIESASDATQEFLTDWLVRRNVDEALSFLAETSMACVSIDDDAESEQLRGRQARDVLRTAMRAVLERLGPRDNLTVAVESLIPANPANKPIDHRFNREFAIVQMTPQTAAPFLCQPLDPSYGEPEFWGALFRFKMEGGGVLGLLWVQHQGRWQIVAWQVFGA